MGRQRRGRKRATKESTCTCQENGRRQGPLGKHVAYAYQMKTLVDLTAHINSSFNMTKFIPGSETNKITSVPFKHQTTSADPMARRSLLKYLASIQPPRTPDDYSKNVRISKRIMKNWGGITRNWGNTLQLWGRDNVQFTSKILYSKNRATQTSTSRLGNETGDRDSRSFLVRLG